jgi:hypothetical protein
MVPLDSQEKQEVALPCNHSDELRILCVMRLDPWSYSYMLKTLNVEL